MGSILKFKGEWRIYQKRVLNRADDYLKDGKIHIVAAPGSGKTTLGIELIGRIDRPSLILAPSITIREQWIERIKDGFLEDGISAAEYISNNLKEPKYITVATYQALHSAMTGYRGTLTDEDTEAGESDDQPLGLEEEVDYSDFKLINMMKEINLGVICLDECHHLRSEWWKALESFKKAFETANVISLTATPPYDSTPSMWKRYIDMCGEIDEEITIPELVKDGSLCPHQDYVIFNYPTKMETGEINTFRKNSKLFLNEIMEDGTFEEIIKSHRGLMGELSDDALLDNPAYLSSILIYLNEKKIEFPKRLKALLGAKRLPGMNEKWMELLLQGLLYDDTDSYACDRVYLESIIARLKSKGLIEKRKVCMTASKAISKLLLQSKGKVDSIKQIVESEYESMGSGLRMLILTDYIRKEYEQNLGSNETEINQLGVLPFFEILRRDIENSRGSLNKLRLGVLCGSMVIIPAEAKEALIQIAGHDRLMFSKVGRLSEDNYILVKAVGNTHFLTAAITELFSMGYIETLIGTKSLLGEGWDAPCVNSLVLASFVGSFMLSNQMRGRAIRIDKNNPDKTSNIWHLVCIMIPEKSEKQLVTELDSEDYKMLERRMEHFMGLHYEDETIENGTKRLSAIKYPLSKANVKQTNQAMLNESKQRDKLKKRWQEALGIYEQVEIAEEVDISEHLISMSLFFDAIYSVLVKVAFVLIALFINLSMRRLVLTGIIIEAALGVGVLISLFKIWTYHSPMKRLKVFAEGIRQAMLEKEFIAKENCKVSIENEMDVLYAAYLQGGTGKEKSDFANAVVQFFSEIDNQRYILVKKGRRKGINAFYAVPDLFAKKKEDAELFANCMKKFIGHYDVVYTRNPEGRKLLLEGRVKAFGNRENRCVKRSKKVKGALE